MSIAPQIYGDKVPQRMISTKLKRVQRRIVMLHDYYRTKVLPPAANMLSMVSYFVHTSYEIKMFSYVTFTN